MKDDQTIKLNIKTKSFINQIINPISYSNRNTSDDPVDNYLNTNRESFNFLNNLTNRRNINESNNLSQTLQNFNKIRSGSVDIRSSNKYINNKDKTNSN